MFWFLAAVIVLWLAVTVPGFRKLLGALLGVGVIAGLGLHAWIEHQSSIQEQEDAAAKQRIRSSEVELIDMRMGTAGPSVDLAGRARNNSAQYTLTRIELRLFIEDCSDKAVKCDIVGDEVESISVTVPPGQVRDISESVYFRDLGSARPGRGWRYSVVSVSGR